MRIQDLLYNDYYIATLRDDFVVCQVTYSDNQDNSRSDSKHQIQGRVIFSNFYESPFHNIIGKTNMTIKKITKETNPEYFL